MHNSEHFSVYTIEDYLYNNGKIKLINNFTNESFLS